MKTIAAIAQTRVMIMPIVWSLLIVFHPSLQFVLRSARVFENSRLRFWFQNGELCVQSDAIGAVTQMGFVANARLA